MPVSVIIHWYGPFSHTDVPEHWYWDDEKLLYMALGAGNVLRYVGRTEKDPKSRLNAHHKVTVDDSLYIGRVSTSGIPGPKPKKVPKDLDAAEHALIFALQPKRNEHLRERPPEDCVVVYSRTFDHPLSEAPTMPPPKFPTIVIYDPSLKKPVRLQRGPL